MYAHSPNPTRSFCVVASCICTSCSARCVGRMLLSLGQLVLLHWSSPRRKFLQFLLRRECTNNANILVMSGNQEHCTVCCIQIVCESICGSSLPQLVWPCGGSRFSVNLFARSLTGIINIALISARQLPAPPVQCAA